jgi:hypothetical protein
MEVAEGSPTTTTTPPHTATTTSNSPPPPPPPPPSSSNTQQQQPAAQEQAQPGPGRVRRALTGLRDALTSWWHQDPRQRLEAQAPAAFDVDDGDLNEEVLLADLKNFHAALDERSNLHRCAACGESLGLHLFVRDVHTNGAAIYDAEDSIWAPLCGRRVESNDSSAALHICSECMQALRRGSKPGKALVFDPVEQPFSALTADERRLVRPINPILQLRVLPGTAQQVGCIGNTINFLNDSLAVASRLPRMPSAADIVYVARKNAAGIVKKHAIRPAVIRAALMHAKATGHAGFRNSFVDDALLAQLEEAVRAESAPVIDEDEQADPDEPTRTGGADDIFVHFDAEDEGGLLAAELAQFAAPDEAALLHQLAADTQLPGQRARLGDQPAGTSNSPGAVGSGSGSINNKSSSHCPPPPPPGPPPPPASSSVSDTQQQQPPTLQQDAVQPRDHSAEPVNEYAAGDDLWVAAFPHLFPGGRGGPSEYPGNKPGQQPNVASWVKHCLLYHDQRFAQDLEFLFFSYNFLLRRRIDGIMAAAKRRDVGETVDVSADADTITGDQLRAAGTALLHSRGLLPRHRVPEDNVISEGIRILNSLSVYGDKLPGTPAQMQLERRRVLAMISSGVTDPATVFTTYSAADMHWLEMFRMLGYKDKPAQLVVRTVGCHTPQPPPALSTHLLIAHHDASGVCMRFRRWVVLRSEFRA